VFKNADVDAINFSLYHVGPLLWSSGQEFLGTDPEVLVRFPTLPERVPLSLVRAIEELLERKSSGSGLENRDYGHRNPSRWTRGTLYPQTLALTSSSSRFRSAGMVRSRTQATEFSFLVFLMTFACPT
jgi:hypothetical protein